MPGVAGKLTQIVGEDFISLEAATNICGSNLGGQGEIGITQPDKDQMNDF